MRWKFAVVALAMLSAIGGVEGANPPIHLDDNGKLVYVADEKWNIVPDYSHAGYGGGGVDIPLVPVRAVVEPGPGDDGDRIQAAIDRVSGMEPDAHGHRGAVLLKKGRYGIEGTIRISTGGVVLRGEGRDPEGTVLVATGTGRRTLIEVGAIRSLKRGNRTSRKPREAWRAVPGTRREIVDVHVPVGARSFEVESARGLAVGDRIIVQRRSTSEWISTIGMDRIPPRRDGREIKQWEPGRYDLRFDRVITGVSGQGITIDVPLTNAIEREYGGGFVYKYEFPDRLAQVGIEDLRGESEYGWGWEDENHAWSFIGLDAVENAWVRRITGVHFAYACVHAMRYAKWVTVEDSSCLDAVSRITGGRRYSFTVTGQMILVQHCRTRNGRHDFILHSRMAGPNVFLDSNAEQAHNDSGPHHRWSTGALFDNVHVRGDALNVENRGNKGTGHGWTGAQVMIWNSSADSINCETPPTARNWIIGSSVSSGDCYSYSENNPVAPRSLYLKQLEERLGRRR